MALASERGIKSVAFPSLSTGAYGYPLELAAPLALKTVLEYIRFHQDISLVRFVLYGDEAYRAYEKALAALTSVAEKEQG